MTFRKVTEKELCDVRALYASVLGGEFCVWNEFYPGEEELRGDFAAGCLYGLFDGEELISTVSVVPENELDGFDIWRVRGGHCEIARIAVKKERQGMGLARATVGEMLRVLQKEGKTAVHLSAHEGNLPALSTYKKLGFCQRGEADLYGGHYLLLEKILTEGRVDGDQT